MLTLAEKLKIIEELKGSKGRNFIETAGEHGISRSSISRLLKY